MSFDMSCGKYFLPGHGRWAAIVRADLLERSVRNRLIATTYSRRSFRLEYLNECKVRIEHTRAEANEELTDTLHEHEMGDAARFDRMEREWENQHKDPDDVFFQARDRKQEIKEQIKELQNALKRQRAKPKSRTRRKRRG